MLHSGKVCTTDGERTVPRLWRLPQLKRGVEHDYHIYTWNSACTMEGIDMAMVWNSLLNDTSGAICRRFHGREQTGTGTTAAAWRLAGGRIVTL